MSDIYELKSQFCECNLRRSVVHFSSSFTLPIRNEFDINYVKLWTFFCRFYMLSIKFNYAASFSVLKLQSWFHPSAGSFDLWATFLLVFCAFGCFTFLLFVRKRFLILWNVKRDFYLATAFDCCLLIPHSVFCSVSCR